MKCFVHLSVFPAALLLSQLAGAQAFGPTQRVTNTVLDPQFAFAADVDGDGDPEPFALSGFDGQISYWDNRNAMNFGPQTVVPFVEVGLEQGIGGDFDGDGFGDIAVSTEGGELLLFTGDGGNAWSRTVLMTGVDVITLSKCDLNSDGIEDLVSILPDGLGWHESRPALTPLPRVFIHAVDTPWFDYADVDNDGDFDFMVVRTGSNLTWMRNEGNGVFSPRQLSVPIAGSWGGATFADISPDGNPDGNPDLIWEVTYPIGFFGFFDYGEVYVSEGYGDGTFNQGQRVFAYTIYGLGVCYPQRVPLNNQALTSLPSPTLQLYAADPAQSSSCSPRTGLVYSPGTGLFGSDWVETSAFTDVAPQRLVDVDQDGTPDQLLGGQRMLVESVVAVTTYELSDTGGGDAAVESLDLNSDGRRDILAAGTRRGEFALFLGLGNQQFARRRLIGFDLGPVDAGCDPTLIDADLDGDLDIAFPVSSTQFGWLERDGASFIDYHLEGLPGGSSANGLSDLKAVDLDGDGDKDVLYSSNSNVSWFQSFGVAFGPQQILTAGTNAFAHDLNEDGTVDIILGGSRLRWMEGIGAGGFLPPTAFGPSGGSEAIAFDDVSGDGRADLLVSDGDLAWYQNFGGLFFGPRQIIDATPDVRFETADLDGDGDVDLVTSQGTGATWYENLGGVYGQANEIPGLAFSGQGGLALRDMDGDGDLDGLLTSDVDVGWFENLLPPPTGIGSIYCSPGVPNSTGLPGRMRADGSAAVADQDVTISALDLPTSSFGFFITSRQAGFAFPVSNSEGALCVTGSIGRYVGPGQIQNSGTAGEFSLAL
ncbi:VCBS repeat-containing protein, partial [Planctomycetota bacterium]|nr:VCBS repeat-containing protein [Planctomycetota bacterium]